MLFLESFEYGVLNCVCGDWNADVPVENSLEVGRLNSRLNSPDTGDAMEKLGGEFDDNDLRMGLEVILVPGVLNGFSIKWDVPDRPPLVPPISPLTSQSLPP